jgi:hypothetical protein
MKENKGDEGEMSEGWDQVAKAVNQATELYLKELETYLGWFQNVRKEMLEQTFATTQRLSEMGEAQFAFLARMQKNFPLFGGMPKWTEVPVSAREPTEKRPGRAT